MIYRNQVFCDECKKEMLAVDEETHSCEGYGGWGDFETAQMHICEDCYTEAWANLGEICKYECYTPWRCKKYDDCWYVPVKVQSWPYETYYAPRKIEGNTNPIPGAEDAKSQD